MVRMQIQLEESQHRSLKSLAVATKVSISEIVRRAVGDYVKSDRAPTSEERRQRAMSAIGRFRSGRSDVSERHDDYLSAAFRR